MCPQKILKEVVQLEVTAPWAALPRLRVTFADFIVHMH